MIKCLECDKETKNKKFCSGSCRTTYHNRGVNRYNTPKRYCNHCNIETKNPKYCSNNCQREYEYENITKPRVESGLGGTTAIRRYMFREHEEKCTMCGVGNVWNDMPLTLEIDHIDGNSDNNNIDNLRILCPNCHTQTPTYGSKGIGTYYRKMTKRNILLRKTRGYE